MPVRLYLEKGLGLDPAREEPDPDEWLDPMSRGGLLHDIYSAFLRALRAETRRPAKTDWNVLWDIAKAEWTSSAARCRRFRRRCTRPKMEQLERDLRLFLKLEVERRRGDGRRGGSIRFRRTRPGGAAQPV